MTNEDCRGNAAAKRGFIVAKAEREQCERLEQIAREALEDAESDTAHARKHEANMFAIWKKTWESP